MTVWSSQRRYWMPFLLPIHIFVQSKCSFFVHLVGSYVTHIIDRPLRYFDKLMHILTRDVFDWDIANGRSGTSGGVFGRTKAFFAATKSQNSTDSPHAHILVWIEGLPTTVTEYYALLKNERYRRSMLE